jgi:hypothetical protein
MRTPFRYWVIAVAAAALTTTAAAQMGKPKLIKNSVKYSDLGSHPVTGRSGSAMLTGSALINKDLTADIDLASSSVVNRTVAAGNIAKVQLKVSGNSGTPILVSNWNGLTGGSYFHQNVTGLGRGQYFQIQGNITGINGARTDVVTFGQKAALRPDLMVSGISPSTGMANTPINITAVVQELNGDTGAWANCVLYVNNTFADQASGIWVDAGGTVSCMFTPRSFPSPGTYNLKVAVESVTPADYDTANNSATATITIASADNLGYTATASDYQLNDSSQETATEYFDGQVVYFNGTQASDSGWQQYSDLLFAKQSGLLVFPVNATMAESSGGSGLNGNFANITADSTSTSQCTPSATCSESWSWRQNGEFSLFLDVKTVSDTIAGTSGSFSGEVQRNDGDVTYLSAFAFCTWSADPQCPGDAVYIQNQPNQQASGTRLPFSTAATDMLQFAMTDAAGTQYSANPVIPLSSSVLQSQQPWTCSNEAITADLSLTSCSSINKSSVGVAGSVTSPPQ